MPPEGERERGRFCLSEVRAAGETDRLLADFRSLERDRRATGERLRGRFVEEEEAESDARAGSGGEREAERRGSDVDGFFGERERLAGEADGERARSGEALRLDLRLSELLVSGIPQGEQPWFLMLGLTLKVKEGNYRIKTKH